MKYVLPALAAVLALASGAHAQENTLIRYQLDNGLDVVLVPDHRVPKILLDMSYRVGSMNEPAGRSGFAHLFEHLMFSGTPAYPNIDVAYGEVGVSINAFTYSDRTIYFAQGMPYVLPMMLAVEADRMANQGAVITADDLDIQRDVVLNEMRQNTLDYVTGTAWEAIYSALYPESHPYHRAVIGSIPDLEAATIEDVHAFFDIYYVPNNATIVLTGDFEVEDAKALIADTFGRIARGADVPRPSADPTEPTRARVTVEDKVPAPALMFGWLVPPIQDDEFGALRIAFELIENPEYGVMRRSVVDAGLAASASIWVEGGYLGSRFLVQINGVEGVDAAELEAAGRKAIADFLATDLTPAALERERRRVLIDDRVANEKLQTMADNLLIFTEVRNDPGFVLEDDPAVLGATAESVMALARRYLEPDDMSVVVIMPGDRGTFPDVLTKSSGTSAPLQATARTAIDIPKLAPREVEPAAAPEVENAVLSNGIRVVHYPLPSAALTYLAAVSAGGTATAPAGKEGVIELAAGMAPRGGGGLSPIAFGEAVRDLGAELLWKADDMASAITLSAPPDTLDAAISLLADAILRPNFDPREWDVLLSATLDELGLREGNLDEVAARYGEAALFPRTPGQTAVDRSIASVKRVTLDDAKAAFARMFTPKNVAFYSVGSAPLEDIVVSLERAFGTWSNDAEPLRSSPREPATFPTASKILIVPEPDSSQSAIYVAAAAPGYDDEQRAEAEVVFNLLNYEFISRINSVIREEKGFTYGTSGMLFGGVRTQSVMTVEAPVESSVVGPALEEILKGFASLRTEPPREDERNRSVVENYSMIAETAETGQGLFDALWDQLAMGSSIEEMHEVRTAITEIDLDNVRATAEKLAATDRLLIVVVGDPAALMPQLTPLGLPVEVIERNL